MTKTKFWKRCEKRCEIAKKGVKLLILRNFQWKTYVNHIYSCSNYSRWIIWCKKIEIGVKTNNPLSPEGFSHAERWFFSLPRNNLFPYLTLVIGYWEKHTAPRKSFQTLLRIWLLFSLPRNSYYWLLREEHVTEKEFLNTLETETRDFQFRLM